MCIRDRYIPGSPKIRVPNALAQNKTKKQIKTKKARNTWQPTSLNKTNTNYGTSSHSFYPYACPANALRQTTYCRKTGKSNVLVYQVPRYNYTRVCLGLGQKKTQKNHTKNKEQEPPILRERCHEKRNTGVPGTENKLTALM